MTNKYIYISVGSNIEPQKNIPRSLKLLQNHVIIHNISPVFVTDPIGPNKNQDQFYNCVIETSPLKNYSPREFKFNILRKVEDELGRIRTIDKYAPRTIDLDILLFMDILSFEEDLLLPDPDIFERDFLIAGLLYLNPNLKVYPNQLDLFTLANKRSLDTLKIDCNFTIQLRKEFLL